MNLNLPNCEIGAPLEVLARGLILFNQEQAKPEGEKNELVAATHLGVIGVFNAKARPRSDLSGIEACVLHCPRCESNARIDFSEPLITYYLPDKCPDSSDDLKVVDTWGPAE